MRKKKVNGGVTYLVTPEDVPNFVQYNNKIKMYEFLNKETGETKIIPRTSKITSFNFDLKEIDNKHMVHGREVHTQIEDGKIIEIIRPIKDRISSMLKEIQFIHISPSFCFSGKADLVDFMDGTIYDIKTGGWYDHYYYQLLFYCFAFGLEKGATIQMTPKFGHEMRSFLFFEDQLSKVEKKVLEYNKIFEAILNQKEKEVLDFSIIFNNDDIMIKKAYQYVQDLKQARDLEAQGRKLKKYLDIEMETKIKGILESKNMIIGNDELSLTRNGIIKIK